MGSSDRLASLAFVCYCASVWRYWTLYLSFRLGSLWRSNSFFTIVPTLPPQAYLTLSLRHLGFTTTQTNLLTIPASVIGMMTLLSIAFISEVVNSRIAVALIAQSWVMILLIALYTFDANTSSWVYFAVVSLIAGSPAVHPIQTAWVSRNACSVRTRFVYYYPLTLLENLNFWSGRFLQACTTWLFRPL